jgi:hypothetical protein
MENATQLSAVPNRTAARRFTLGLYAATLFLSASLIFAIQPMFTKMVLPRLGGAPSVWSVAMVVFQTALFIGYVYAHLLVRALKPRQAVLVHFAFLAVVALGLPLGIAKGFGTPPEHGVTLWLVGLFFASIGLPFIALAASAPLLQSWFAATGHKQAANPYVLYAASNLGSFAALLAYPFLIEPLFSLQTQISLWSAGFCALAVLIAFAAFLVTGRTLDTPGRDAEAIPRPSVAQCLSWTVYAAIPSALVIAVTAYISTDLAAAPFLWVLPLALYLLTFVAVFRERPWFTHATVLRIIPCGVAPLAVNAFGGDMVFWLLFIVINLTIFVLIALGCHGEAYRTRPHRGRLTEFYLWISFGGMLGGVFAGLIAPNVFNSSYEYPILLAATLLVLPGMFEGGWRQFLRNAGPWLIATAAIMLVGLVFDIRALLGAKLPSQANAVFLVAFTVLILFNVGHLARFFGITVLALSITRLWTPGVTPILMTRSFFGVHQVVETADRTHYLLFHGTTIHGAMRVRDASGQAVVGRPELLTYYYVGGPISDAIEATRGARGTFSNVAVIGLGTGSLACHRHDGEQWSFFEIDPEVVRIARDPTLFRFLSACAPSAPIVLGDARLTLAATPGRYDLIVLDAFSSDAIPIHLLTREAFAGYLSRRAPHGVIAVHVSNRNMELASVVAAVGAAEGLVSYVKYDRALLDFGRTYRANAIVVVLAKEIADLGDLPSREGWYPAMKPGVAAWTDDYSNVLGAIIRQKFGG